MSTIGIHELSRNASKVIEEVERTGTPALITRHGRLAVAIVPVDIEGLEDFILARAPAFAGAMREADTELREGTTRALSAVLGELDAQER